MKKIKSIAVATLTATALLGLSVSTQAQVLNLVPNGDFEIAEGEPGATWINAGPADVSYPTTGGNSGGYGALDSSVGWGVLVSEIDPMNGLTLDSLGLTAGENYTFSFDMIDLADDTFEAGIKLEGWNGGVDVGNTGDVIFDPTTSWANYTTDWIIPADATSIKFVPLSTLGGFTGFDNVGVLVDGVDVPGDYNDDQIVGLDDVDLLSAQLGNASTVNPAMDLNGDMTIDLADHDQHITTLLPDANGTGALIGDLNLDGDVDVSQIAVVGGQVINSGDASVLLANLGTTSGAVYAEGDLNGDGDVDVSQIVVVGGQVQNLGDASRLLANLGQNTVPGAAPSASAVPEPGSLSLLALAGIAGIVRRKKR